MLEDKQWLKGTVLEPCVGNGALIKTISPELLTCYDINSTHPGVTIQDYLLAPIQRFDLVFTNPPFGKVSNLAVRFFNRAALDSNRLAFIVPQTFRKTSIIDRLNPWFHPLFDEVLPDQHFILPNGELRKVKTCFQLWERKTYKRNLFKSFITNDLFFQKVDRDNADFALRTQGSNAGNVLPTLCNKDGSTFSSGTTCYIKGDRKQIDELDLQVVSSFTASVPAIGLQDIRLALMLPPKQQHLFLNKGASSLLAYVNKENETY